MTNETKKPFYRLLYFQVLVAIAIGVILGTTVPEFAVKLKPLGEGFVKLVKMMIAPIIFCTVINGIAGSENLKKVGRVGIKALLYFEVLTTLALIIGMVIINIVKPGESMNVDISTLDPGAISNYTAAAKSQGVVDFILNIIPTQLVDAFAKGEVLQILLISVLMGLALVHERNARPAVVEPIIRGIEVLSKVLFRMVETLMHLAPLGALGAMSFTIGKGGIASLLPLAKLMACFYLTCILFITVVLGGVARWNGLSIWRLIRFWSDELFLVLGTSSSESALPRMMSQLERLGCGKAVVGLVIPAGYSFNLDGTSIYLTMAALFIAQAAHVDLSIGQQIVMLSILLLSSKGAAGVTGSGFITLAATLSAFPSIPMAGLVLILGIDRFMSEARALTNLIGNGVATIVVSRWEGEFDDDKAKAILGAGGR